MRDANVLMRFRIENRTVSGNCNCHPEVLRGICAVGNLVDPSEILGVTILSQKRSKIAHLTTGTTTVVGGRQADSLQA